MPDKIGVKHHDDWPAKIKWRHDRDEIWQLGNGMGWPAETIGFAGLLKILLANCNTSSC